MNGKVSGNSVKPDITLHIEEATEYKEQKLNKKVQEVLNIHSIYRKFRIDKSILTRKRVELGVETMI